MLVVILHDLSRLQALLEAWKKIGVPGVTLVNSLGGLQAASWLSRFGIGRQSGQADSQQRMIFSIIQDEELLERAISEADQVIDGFDRPHSGILFAIPVSHALGIRKRGHPVFTEAAAGSDIWQDSAIKIDRATPVSKLVKILELNPSIVQADEPIRNIVGQALSHPRSHVINVVNRENRLMGLIDLASLADALFFMVFPEEFLSEITELEQVMSFAQRTHVHLAEDIMREPVWVKMDDTLEIAFKRMHEHKLTGLPVIDDHYHITGFINLLELMTTCLDQEDNEEGTAA